MAITTFKFPYVAKAYGNKVGTYKTLAAAKKGAQRAANKHGKVRLYHAFNGKEHGTFEAKAKRNAPTTKSAARPKKKAIAKRAIARPKKLAIAKRPAAKRNAPKNPKFQVISYSKYNTVMRKFATEDAARRYQEKLNRRGDGVYGVQPIRSNPAAKPAGKLTGSRLVKLAKEAGSKSVQVQRNSRTGKPTGIKFV